MDLLQLDGLILKKPPYKMIQLIFFIPLFYLTMSSGLPPGTMKIKATPPTIISKETNNNNLNSNLFSTISNNNNNSKSKPNTNTSNNNNNNNFTTKDWYRKLITSKEEDFVILPNSLTQHPKTDNDSKINNIIISDKLTFSTPPVPSTRSSNTNMMRSPTLSPKATASSQINSSINSSTDQEFISNSSHDLDYSYHHHHHHQNHLFTQRSSRNSNNSIIRHLDSDSVEEDTTKIITKSSSTEAEQKQSNKMSEEKESRSGLPLKAREKEESNKNGIVNGSITSRPTTASLTFEQLFQLHSEIMRNQMKKKNNKIFSTSSVKMQQQQEEKEEYNHSNNSLPIPMPLVQNYTAKVPLRGPCNSTFRCMGDYVICLRGSCQCQEGYAPSLDERHICRDLPIYNLDLPTTDPTMIGVVIGLIFMSITLCVVLRLFAKARFRENRTIFNTPNPRLMNVSLLKGGKQLLRGNSGGNVTRSKRGSQASIQSAVAEEIRHNQHGPGNGESSTGVSAAATSNQVTSPTESHGKSNSSSIGTGTRPKTLRQLSTDTASNETVGVTRGGMNTKYKYRQDSVSSNV